MTSDIYLQAIEQFHSWLEQAKTQDEPEPTAMTLASSDPDGRISARIVLLKQIDPKGFVFYTNLGSNKGRQLQANPRAALCFHWKSLERQVKIEGRVEAVSTQEADTYFASRLRGSQIGAWASRQSQTLESRELFEQSMTSYEQKYENAEVPRPDFWSGFRVIPNMIEFWQGENFRLHHRLRYEQDDQQWTCRTLFP